MVVRYAVPLDDLAFRRGTERLLGLAIVPQVDDRREAMRGERPELIGSGLIGDAQAGLDFALVHFLSSLQERRC
jgi:hypothetical protein